jgi:hypothetical protein
MSLKGDVLAELAEKYDGRLPDGYRSYVHKADAATLQRVLDLVRADALPTRSCARLVRDLLPCGTR